MRLGGEVLKSDAVLQSANRRIESMKDDVAQLKIMRRLNLEGIVPRLMHLIELWGPSTASVQAIDLALNQGAADQISQLLTATPASDQAKILAKSLALSDRKDVAAMLESLLTKPEVDTQIKIDASLGLARNVDGQKRLIGLARDGKLPGEAKVLVGATLQSSRDESVRKDAVELFPARKTSQSALPPVNELAKRTGDIEAGKALFAGVATCAQCHIVAGQGKNVGPDLSEIGNKLSREAMYVSILEPSAGISHNYEAYVALTDAGEVVTGLLVSQNGDQVTLRDAKSIERTFVKSELEDFKKSEKSLMPENLQETMTEQGMVDLVEYLMSLKKK